MVPALMSRSSNETSVWRAPARVVGLSAHGAHGLRKFWSPRGERHLLQMESEKAEPQFRRARGANNVSTGWQAREVNSAGSSSINPQDA